MSDNILSPIVLSLQCSLLSGLINIPWGLFWGWILARKKFEGKVLLQTLLYIPLVLPPVLTGYFLLILFSKNSPLGRWLYEIFSIRFVLDWKGVVLASAVVSSPFMIQAIKQSLEKVDPRLELAARSLGANFWKVWTSITLPLSWQGIVAGFFLVFARSMGEFGATIMVAGNIPHQTQTIPLAIYSKVYLGQEAEIFPFVVAAIVVSYVGLGISGLLTRNS
jgi:molybdate transport system permease protein